MWLLCVPTRVGHTWKPTLLGKMRENHAQKKMPKLQLAAVPASWESGSPGDHCYKNSLNQTSVVQIHTHRSRMHGWSASDCSVFPQTAPSSCPPTTWTKLKCWATALPSWRGGAWSAADRRFTSKTSWVKATISRSAGRYSSSQTQLQRKKTHSSIWTSDRLHLYMMQIFNYLPTWRKY